MNRYGSTAVMAMFGPNIATWKPELRPRWRSINYDGAASR